ncbi:MAG: T9SS type A sorting domain-containing protein [Saprospiraceae bacterium]|nr:T9SS type A sorting domain-containing protein [Saprospiraceae bacterium]
MQRLYILFLAFFVLSPLIAQPNFTNNDFEDNSQCSLTNCDDNDISCAVGWWNFYTSVTVDSTAWISYTCADPDLDVCGNYRGLLLSNGDNPYRLAAVSSNPLYGEDSKTAYTVEFDFLPLENSDTDIFVAISGSNDSLAGTLDLFAVTDTAISKDGDCRSMELTVYKSLDGTEMHISEYENIVFHVSNSDPRSAPSNPLPRVNGVIDNLSICFSFSLTVSEATCDSVCLQFDFDESCSSLDCESCSIEFEFFSDPNTLYQIDNLEDTIACFETPTSIDSVVVSYYFQQNGEEVLIKDTAQILPQCVNSDITINTTWSASTVPNNGRFDTVTVKDGYILTIQSDAVLKFCKDGVMILEPGARLNLYGKLTSLCDEGWNGVQAYGDSEATQELANQGRFNGYPGSVVENAKIGVQLWGPGLNDTGGQIDCDSTTFRNNFIGIQFRPFRNFFPITNHKRPYYGILEECIFVTDSNYLFSTPFLAFVQMYGVDGVRLRGCSFTNTFVPSNPTRIYQFGYGFHASNSGFSVTPTSSVITDVPCLPPCIEYNRTSFSGLGYGISASRSTVNYRYIVSQADFSDCYVGIQSNGVSMATIILNDFALGSLPDTSVMADQIGVYLISAIAGITIEENVFHEVDGNTANTLGIVTWDLGEFDNYIRKNTFDEITIGNEAFGQNAISDGAETGLRFTCNVNTDVTSMDFYIVDTSIVAFSSICADQFDYDTAGLQLATGNKFSETGNEDYGDFNNRGHNVTLEYGYDDEGENEEPIDYFGIDSANILIRDKNECAQNYCVAPCLTPSEFDNQQERYYESRDSFDAIYPDYKEAVAEEDSVAADSLSRLLSFYQSEMDLSSSLLATHILVDTTGISSDSLDAWYSRMSCPAADLMRSGVQLNAGNDSVALDLLDSIPEWNNLNQAQEEDIERYHEIYSIVGRTPVDSLPAADVDSIESIGNEEYGYAWALSKAILMLYDEHFDPIYYLDPTSSRKPYYLDPVKPTPVKPNADVTIYPNPSDGNLTIEVSKGVTRDNLHVSFYDMSGKEIASQDLRIGSNTVVLQQSERPSVTVFYRILNNDGLVHAGRLVILGEK